MTDTATWPAPSSAMAPVPYRVRDRVAENRDSATLSLEPVREPLPAPRPGEFMMMYAFGIGEIAVSVSGVPDRHRRIHHPHDPLGRRGEPGPARHAAGHGDRHAWAVRHQLGSGRRRRP